MLTQWESRAKTLVTDRRDRKIERAAFSTSARVTADILSGHSSTSATVRPVASARPSMLGAARSESRA